MIGTPVVHKFVTRYYYNNAAEAQQKLTSVPYEKRGASCRAEPLNTTPGRIWRVDVLNPGFTSSDDEAQHERERNSYASSWLGR